jgi:hypothetical protein
MDPVNLADKLPPGSGSALRWIVLIVVWLFEHPVIGIPVAAVLVTGVVYVSVWIWKYRRSLLSGTARVLSLGKSADYRGPALCRIELEVNIPGREPYVVLTEQSLRPAEQAVPQPAIGASGQVDLSAYVSRPLPLGWMSRPSSWACQLPTNGASPGTSAAADGAKTRAAVANPANAIFLIFISTNQNGLTVVSLPMNMPCPVPSLVKRMPSPPATTVQPWMW